MRNKWWQRKWAFGTGALGGVLIMLLPVLGVLVWPLYQPMTYPVAILTASDAQNTVVFHSISVLAYLMIIFFGLILRRYFSDQQQRPLQQAVSYWVVALGLFVIINYFLPAPKMSSLAVPTVIWNLRNVTSLVVNLTLASIFWLIGQRAWNANYPSIANIVKLTAWLFLLFNGLEWLTTWLGWPLLGMMDLFSFDTLMVGVIYLSWYFMRQAE